MSDGDNASPEPETTEAAATEPAGQEPSSVEQLPEWAQNQIKKARDEAAKHRTEKRELKTQLEQASESASHVSDLERKVSEYQDAVSDKDAELGKLRAVLDAGVSADRAVDIASRIKGANAEEWAQDAAQLAELFGGSNQPEKRADPSQGAGNVAPLNGDSIENGIRDALGID